MIRPEELLADAPRGATDFGSPDGPQPLMIRTTGTTGAPKAARHDWRVLAQTVAKVQPRPDQRWLLAYGPQQFAGIQVLLHVVASQATLVAPFPRQPKDGLDALLSDDVTCVSATPTYWRFLLAEARSRKPDSPAWSRSPSVARPVPPTSSTSSEPPSLPGCRRCTHRPSSAPSRR